MHRSDQIKFYLISLGCSKNLVDSEKVQHGLLTAGFHEAESSEDADIIIVNTCGFINDARAESIEVIMDSASDSGKVNFSGFKKKLAVMGCLSERYMKELQTELNEADLITGIPDEHFVPNLCREFGIEMTTRPERGWTPLTSGLPYSYIKIAEGCSNNCTYCAIPLIRGPHESYSPDDIMEQVGSAAARGVKELILVGQDTASYSWGTTGLRGLIEMISAVKGIEWIRIMYMHPDRISDEIIEAIAENHLVVKYIDLPFQHASGKILASMGRKGSAEIYLSLIDKLRSRIKGIKLRSTFMTGFPGETPEDFRELVEFIKAAQLDRAGLFIYSEEEGTPAIKMKGRVPLKTRRSRYNTIMELLENISLNKLESMIGSDVRVLVEEKIDDSTYLCRTEYDAPEVDGIFILTSEKADINSIITARITGSSEYDLYGVPI